MPHVIDPARGWIATANNRPAPEDFPYPLSGTWDEDHRARRVGELVKQTDRHDLESFGRIHGDVLSVRARHNRDDLVAAVAGRLPAEDEPAIDILAAWDTQATPDSAGALIWEVILARWQQAAAAERLPAASADYVAGFMPGFARSLLGRDDEGWFASDGRRLEAIATTTHAALEELRVGPRPRPDALALGRCPPVGAPPSAERPGRPHGPARSPADADRRRLRHRPQHRPPRRPPGPGQPRLLAQLGGDRRLRLPARRRPRRS